MLNGINHLFGGSRNIGLKLCFEGIADRELVYNLARVLNNLLGLFSHSPLFRWKKRLGVVESRLHLRIHRQILHKILEFSLVRLRDSNQSRNRTPFAQIVGRKPERSKTCDAHGNRTQNCGGARRCDRNNRTKKP